MRFLLIFLLFGSVSLSSHAREVAGVNLAEEIILPDSTKLKINGAGIRTKFIFNIYVSALYVSQPTLTSPEKVISDTGAKRMLMHFLYDEVSKEKLNGGWDDGFKNNLDEASFSKLEQRLETFKSFFTTVKKGDVIYLDYLPGQGTKVSINAVEKGVITGQDFHQALMRVWLGEEPADWNLKASLLGQ